MCTGYIVHCLYCVLVALVNLLLKKMMMMMKQKSELKPEIIRFCSKLSYMISTVSGGDRMNAMAGSAVV